MDRLYFRARDNGAQVFRIDTENRHRRLDLQHVATVNLRSGEVKLQNQQSLAPEEEAEIHGWVAARRETVAAREEDDIARLVDQIQQAAQWMQSKATPEQVEALSDALLMAMHDLRGVIVRRRGQIARDRSED
ncbi:MAG: hypothetical protein ACPGID_04940 [Rubricella sp.]